MIKLKSLIRENRPIVPNDIRYYWNFMANALSGRMRHADNLYHQYQESIDLMAKELRKRYGPNISSPVYRGILLDDHEVHNGEVSGDFGVTFVSFTEDKDIAIGFADTENDMSSFVVALHPTKKGYLITKPNYDFDLLLFHYSWLDKANMRPVWRQIFGDDADIVDKQKEVTLKPERRYEVVPVPPGASGGAKVGSDL